MYPCFLLSLSPAGIRVPGCCRGCRIQQPPNNSSSTSTTGRFLSLALPVSTLHLLQSLLSAAASIQQQQQQNAAQQQENALIRRHTITGSSSSPLAVLQGSTTHPSIVGTSGSGAKAGVVHLREVVGRSRPSPWEALVTLRNSLPPSLQNTVVSTVSVVCSL